MTKEQLLALATEVKKYRDELAWGKSELWLRQDAFNAENANRIEANKMTAVALQGAESDLRKATVEAYLADPAHNKAVLPGVVAIRDNTVVGYNPVSALDWAIEHKVCLRLDEKLYETLVKAGQAPGGVVVEPQATIARDIKLPETVS